MRSAVFRFTHRFSQHRHLLLLAFVMGLTSALLSHHRLTESLDWLWFDATQQLSSLPSADDIVIIEIDERSIQQLGRWPWPRDRHAQLLSQLPDSQAIFFDVIFSDPDQLNPAADAEFAKALGQQSASFLPLYLEQLGHNGQLLEITPAPMFYQAVDGVGHVHVSADRDGVVRSIFLREGVGSAFWPHISLAILNKLQPETSTPAATQTTDHNPHTIVQAQQRWLPMPSAQQGIVHFSFVDVIEGHISSQHFHNKIVFVGATAPGLGDIFTTSIGNMAGVELNAWAFQALRHQQLVQPLSELQATLINGLLIFILCCWFGRLSPRSLLLATSISALSLLAVAAYLQLHQQIWLSLIPASICLLLFYPLWSWRRLEVALNYLRQELTRLRDYNPHLNNSDQQLLQQQQRQFWQQLGLSSQRQATLAIEQAPQTIAFNKLYGSELIEQTISQIIREKEAAEINQQLIEKSLEQLQDAVLIADAGGQILFTNQSWNQLLNEVRELELLDQLQRIELPNLKQWSQVLAALFDGESAFSSQGTLNQNIDLFCQLRLSSLSGKTLDTLIITLTNVSQVKAAERSRLEALNFLSHDLRSPMVSVLAILELQRKRIQRQKKTQGADTSITFNDEELLQNIDVLVRKNLSYADSFLHLSRAQTLTEDHLQLCDMHAVIDTAQVHGLALAKSKSIELVTHRTTEDAWVMGDQDALERALINLLSNAVKYSAANTCITLSLRCEESNIFVAIEDQGHGIEAGDIDTLFDRFTRGKHPGEEMGAGLGLNYVATVAKRHQGDISVHSQVGVGSCFTLQLPRTSDSEF